MFLLRLFFRCLVDGVERESLGNRIYTRLIFKIHIFSLKKTLYQETLISRKKLKYYPLLKITASKIYQNDAKKRNSE